MAVPPALVEELVNTMEYPSIEIWASWSSILESCSFVSLMNNNEGSCLSCPIVSTILSLFAVKLTALICNKNKSWLGEFLQVLRSGVTCVR